jgi:hypothetical protein
MREMITEKKEKVTKLRKQVHGGTDRLFIKASSAGTPYRSMSKARDCGADVLPLEEQIRRDAT